MPAVRLSAAEMGLLSGGGAPKKGDVILVESGGSNDIVLTISNGDGTAYEQPICFNGSSLKHFLQKGRMGKGAI